MERTLRAAVDREGIAAQIARCTEEVIAEVGGLRRARTRQTKFLARSSSSPWIGRDFNGGDQRVHPRHGHGDLLAHGKGGKRRTLRPLRGRDTRRLPLVES